MVIAKEWTNVLVEQRETRHRPTYVQSTDLWQRSKGFSTRVFSSNDRTTGPPYITTTKKGYRHGPYSLYKNQMKMNHRPQCKIQDIELLEDSIGENLDDVQSGEEEAF